MSSAHAHAAAGVARAQRSSADPRCCTCWADRLVRIHPEQSFCFRTKERVPYFVCFEVADYATADGSRYASCLVPHTRLVAGSGRQPLEPLLTRCHAPPLLGAMRLVLCSIRPVDRDKARLRRRRQERKRRRKRRAAAAAAAGGSGGGGRGASALGSIQAGNRERKLSNFDNFKVSRSPTLAARRSRVCVCVCPLLRDPRGAHELTLCGGNTHVTPQATVAKNFRKTRLTLTKTLLDSGNSDSSSNDMELDKDDFDTQWTTRGRYASMRRSASRTASTEVPAVAGDSPTSAASASANEGPLCVRCARPARRAQPAPQR